MAVKKKYKKLTNKEKQLKKQVREELRQQGLLPPTKPRLNRKKFAKEVVKEFEDFNEYENLIYLFRAINWMLPTEYTRTISEEQVGLLKTLRVAMDIKRFVKEKINQGETQYNVQELYDTVVAPVIKL